MPRRTEARGLRGAARAGPGAARAQSERRAAAALVLLRLPLLALVLCGAAAGLEAEERRNYFDDPFLQATSGLASCPVPRGPAITEEEMKAQAHDRAQRGTSCWLAGRCRLHNAYLYDKEIAPRAVKAILADGRFASRTSVWILGQRRQVFLQGCVSSAEDIESLRRLVGNIDDVEGVVDQLMVGTTGPPPYPPANP